MVTFEYGALSITFRAPEFSDVYESEHIQARGRTHDGQLVVGDKAIKIVRFQLTWRVLSTAEQVSLENFFSASYVDGSLNTFYYTDHAGVRRPVKLVNDSLDWVNYYIDLWSVDMLLEVVADVTGS